jgi:hypothetical protein
LVSFRRVGKKQLNANWRLAGQKVELSSGRESSAVGSSDPSSFRSINALATCAISSLRYSCALTKLINEGQLMYAICERSSVAALILVSVSLIAGCGAGTVGIAIGLGDDDTTVLERTPTDLDAVTPGDGQSGRVETLLKITLDPNESAELTSVEFSLFGADGPFHPATAALGFPTDLAPGESITGEELNSRASSFTTFVWNAQHDLDELRRGPGTPEIQSPITARAVLRFRIANRTVGGAFEAETGEFFLHLGLTATVAGGGVGDGDAPASASLFAPTAIAATSAGDLLIADSGNHRLRRVELGESEAVRIETLAGNGFRGVLAGIQPARSTSLDGPRSVAARGTQSIFVVEEDEVGTVHLRAVDLASGLLAPLLSGTVPGLRAVAVHEENSLLLLDSIEGLFYSLSLAELGSFPLGLDLSGARVTTGLTSPTAFAVAPDEEVERVYVADFSGSGAARVQLVVDGTTTTLVAGGGVTVPTDITPEDILENPPLATELDLAAVDALAVDGSFFYFADTVAGYAAVVRRGDLRLANVLSGFTQPAGLAVDTGGRLFVLEGGDSFPGSDGAGHQVKIVREPASSLEPLLEPFVAHASGKDNAAGLGGVAANSEEGVVGQTPG